MDFTQEPGKYYFKWRSYRRSCLDGVQKPLQNTYFFQEILQHQSSSIAFLAKKDIYCSSSQSKHDDYSKED